MSESSEAIYAGLSRVTYAGEPLDLGHGIVLRSTYAHLFAANMMAFARAPKGKPHPPPWRAAGGGFGYDVDVELAVPNAGKLPGGLSAEDAIWLIAALLRLSEYAYLMVPVISDAPFNAAAASEREPLLQPFEVEPRILHPGDEEIARLSVETLSWIKEVWPRTAELLRTCPRRTDEMLAENITSADQTHVLFDYEATVYMTDLSRRLLTLPPPAGLAKEMAEQEADALLIMERLTEEVAALEPGLISAAKAFTQAELTQIRTMKEVADSMRRKLLDLLKETTGSFILQNQEPGRRAPMLLRDTMGLFAFRYSLCMLLYYMEWVRIGRQTGKKLPLRVNDVTDMQLAAMGTFFNGVLSPDENLQIISNTARGVLRGFGAYVGDDWCVPERPQETCGGMADASPADPG